MGRDTSAAAGCGTRSRPAAAWRRLGAPGAQRGGRSGIAWAGCARGGCGCVATPAGVRCAHKARDVAQRHRGEAACDLNRILTKARYARGHGHRRLVRPRRAHTCRTPVRHGGRSVHGRTACRPLACPFALQVRRHAGRVAGHPGLHHSPEVVRRTRRGSLRLPVEAMAARAAWLVGELSPLAGCMWR